MPSQSKKDYVSDMLSQLQENPHLVLVGFSGVTHQRMEDLRNKLRESGADAPSFTVLKNSLFKIAFNRFNKKFKVVSADDGMALQKQVSGQLALMLLPEEWMTSLKVVHDFAREEEGIIFKAGIIDRTLYESEGVMRLASLPGKSELIAKIIGTLKAPHSRLVYSLNYPTMKLIYVMRNAGESSGTATS